VDEVRNAQLSDRVREAFARERPDGVAVAWLFGSHARRAAHRDSDVDVGVLLDRRHFADRRERFAARVRIGAWLIGETHCNRVDVVVLNDAPPLLAAHVVSTGERLYCIDEAAAHAFYRDTLLRAAEIAPFLRRMARIKLAALEQ